MNGVDYDLAAHITVIRQVGICLCGKPIAAVFEQVPRENYLDSICRDVQDAPCLLYTSEQQQKINEELENQLEQGKNDQGEVIGRIAFEQYGYGYPDEHIYIDSQAS